MPAAWRRRFGLYPIVVVNWSFLRAMNCAHLPDKFSYVIPEACLVEAATSDDNRRVRLSVKLLRILKANWRRVFLASHVQHLIRAEPQPGTTVDRHAIARMPFFNDEQEANSITEDQLAANLHNVAELERPNLAAKKEFEDLRERFAEVSHQHAARFGGMSANVLPAIEETVRQPVMAVQLANRFEPKYEAPEWKQALSEFPDRHAVGRWCRIALWYFLRKAQGLGTKKLRNDFEDAQYVFTASYADELWTRDGAMKRTVEVLFPHTKVRCCAPQGVLSREEGGL
jgi:hypothetical protein